MFSRKKSWQFVAVVTDQAMLAGAVADLGYLGFGFAYAYDRETGKTRRAKVLTPMGLGVTVAAEPDAAPSRLASPTLRVEHGAGRLVIRAADVVAEVELAPAAPFDTSWTIAGRPHRTRKRMGGRATGKLRLAGRELDLDGAMLSDWSAGEPARETTWRWAAGVGPGIAWNLRTGFDDPSQCENVLWLDGVPTPAGPVTIEPGEPWRILGAGLELVFEADGEQRDDTQLGPVTSRYRQPWGRFTGTYDGRPIGAYGVVEDHYARW